MKVNHPHGMIKIQFPFTDAQSDNLLYRIFHIGSMENQHPCDRINGLEYYQIIICTSGKGLLKVCGEEYEISAEMGFLLKPGVAHEYYSLESPWTTYWLLFDGAGSEMLPFISQSEKFSIFYLSNREKLLFEHQTMYTLAEKNALSNKNALSAACYQFLLDMNDSIIDCRAGNEEQNAERLNKVIRYLEKNYTKDILLEDMAKLAEITPQYLCRLFQSTLRMRPMEYVLYLRMKEAKTLMLTDKNMPINEIAATVGYHDTSYFCRMFRKNTGLTPGEFKKRN